jgi:hypothetical protein
MNKTSILGYDITYDNNDMVKFCKKGNEYFYPFKGEKNMSGLISGRNLERGLIMKFIELRQMSH